MERDRSPLSPPLIAVALFALLLLAYVGGYFARGRAVTTYTLGNPRPAHGRQFPSRFEANLFGPFAFVESIYYGSEVYLGWDP